MKEIRGLSSCAEDIQLLYIVWTTYQCINLLLLFFLWLSHIGQSILYNTTSWQLPSHLSHRPTNTCWKSWFLDRTPAKWFVPLAPCSFGDFKLFWLLLGVVQFWATHLIRLRQRYADLPASNVYRMITWSSRSRHFRCPDPLLLYNLAQPGRLYSNTFLLSTPALVASPWCVRTRLKQIGRSRVCFEPCAITAVHWSQAATGKSNPWPCKNWGGPASRMTSLLGKSW